MGDDVILDEKDREIIKMLKENARASYTEMAKRLGMSDVGVMKRVKRLEQIGVIKKYTIVLDPAKLGYKAVSITGLDADPEHLFKIIDDLKKREHIRYLALTSGDHTIIAVIWARDRDELAKIHDELSSMPGVRRVCPAIILDVVKE